MKKLVAYSSLTGNTKKVAVAIHEEIKGDLKHISEAKNYDEYDFIALGFFVDKGFANDETQEFMSKIKSKKVGIFVTLGAYPDGDHAKDVLQRAKQLMQENKNEVLCEFICQGAIDPKLIEKMRKMAAAQGGKAMHIVTPEREKRWLDASTHPDKSDLENAKKAFANIK